jgi:fibro-slime domain-containing protein
VRAAALAIAVAACGPTAPVAGSPDATSQVEADASDPTPPRGDAGPGCNVLPVTVRDLRISHPDFEHFTSDAVIPGLVEPQLGADPTPTYAHAGPTLCTTGAAEFAAWYHDVPGTNQTIATALELVETGPGVYVYDSSAFFPIDGEGFGNEGLAHNYSFTTEIHTTFRYAGGESFTFRGDDDVWLFINGTLAIDLGGLHQPATATVDLDEQAAALGISPGNTYAMDVFQAERHTTESNFRIETTIDCFIVP